MSAILPSRMDKNLIKEIDRLVKRGLYVSRSDAVRDAVRRLVSIQGKPDLRDLYLILSKAATGLIVHHLKEKVTDVILYGSVAAGVASYESDIDLLILIEEGDCFGVTSSIVSLIYPMELETNVVFSINVYRRRDFVLAVKEEFSFERTIAQKGVQLYGGVLDEVGSKKAS